METTGKQITYLTIDYAQPEDVEEIVAVEKAAWPETDGAMIAQKEKFETRQKIGGLLVARNADDNVIGLISFQKPCWIYSEKVTKMFQKMPKNFEQLSACGQWNYFMECGFPKDWYAATNNGFIVLDGKSTHDPNSDCEFLIGVAIHPDGRGNQLVDKLIQAALNKAKSKGDKFVFGYARMPGYAVYSSSNPIDVLGYMKLKKPGTEYPLDYGLRFHVRNGAKLLSPIPDAMYDDAESLGWGALAFYDLVKS